MVSSKPYDVALIGGGIVGLAAARALASDYRAGVIVLEAEAKLASHQTGHNSGVIHSGLYYKPGSLKARLCADGRDAMYAFCEEHGIAHERCGKVVVATDQSEIPRLDELERRGNANGLQGLKRLRGQAELREYEPHVAGVEGLWVPQTGIVDFEGVAQAIAGEVRSAGSEIRTGARVTSVVRSGGAFVLRAGDAEIQARNLVNCAGLQCDRVARMCGMQPELRIVPFRGEYYKLKPEREALVRNLIYPVPDPRFPFLGVHFTRMILGGVEAGPNAVLSFKREGYGRFDFSAGDTWSTMTFGGFWRLAAKYWKTAAGEVWRSHSTVAFVRALQKLIPEVRPEDVERHGAGVRAQAVSADGRTLDDFEILEGERMLHVLNAPSPAATASLSIGKTLADRAAGLFQLAS